MQSTPPTKSRPPAPLPEGMLQDVPLAPYTTLGVGGPAQFFAAAQDVPHLQSLLRWAKQRSLPVVLLGQGSNVLVSDAGLRGLALRLMAPQIPQPPDARVSSQGMVRLPGGALWSDSVRSLSEQGFYGLEALYGIPGTCAAAPLQNIGAYGQDVGQTLRAIDVVHSNTGEQQTISAEACGLGYRTSHLRGPWRGRYVVTGLHLALQRERSRPLSYPSLLHALEARGLDGAQATPVQVCDAVWAVREARGMVWLDGQAPFGTVGSFFTNPTVPEHVARELLRKHPAMPSWPGAEGRKLSAAWLIEASGLHKGARFEQAQGRAGLSPLHALALINFGGATAQDVVAAATHIYLTVLQQTGVELRAEAQAIGFAAPAKPFA